MAANYKNPYVDASVFMGWANREVINGVDRFAVFETIWRTAEAKQFKIHTSTITWAEIYKLRHQHVPPTPSGNIEMILGELEREHIVPVEVDRDIAIRANYLCRIFKQFKLYPNDAIHLACALEAKCDVLLCWDRSLNSVIHPEIEIQEPALLAPPPTPATQQGLFATPTTTV